MSEPIHDTVAEYVLKVLGYAVTGALSGLGVAMGWFRRQRIHLEDTMIEGQRRTHERIDQVRVEMQAYAGGQASHATDIAVLQAHQENNVSRLEEIQATTRQTNQKVDNLAEQMTDILMEVKRRH